MKAAGIVVDANGDPASRWEQLHIRLAAIFPGFPAELAPTGVIHEVADKPRIGVWLMPDNVRTGMLETLLLAPRIGDPVLHGHARGATRQARVFGAPFRDTHLREGRAARLDRLARPAGSTAPRRGACTRALSVHGVTDS